MPLDPSIQRFLKLLAATNPPGISTLTVAERRAGLQHLLGFSGPPEAVARIEDRTLPGAERELNIRIYTPIDAVPIDAIRIEADVAPLAGLIYFHGGGLIAGNLETHDAICRSLTNASGCRLISVQYRLAPEHPFPEAIADGLAATRWIAAHACELGIDPHRLVIGGDSAGATLAAVVCQMIEAAGDIHLALQFLLCPIMDFSADTDSRRRFGQGYLIDRETLEHDLKFYLGPETNRADPRVSPLRSPDVRHVPPTCIHTAEFDPLRDEAKAYADRLSLAGVQTTYRCHAGMIHLFYGMGSVIPYAGEAVKLMGSDMRAMIAS